MLTPRQKAKLHQMLSLACIPEQEYRAKLNELFDVDTLADERLTNRDYERAAVWIELEICKAVAEGVTPIETVLTKLDDPFQYTRNSLANRAQPRGNAAAKPAQAARTPLKPSDPVTQPQRSKIVALRAELTPLEPEVGDWSYITRILCAASLAPAPDTLDKLTVAQASALINALADRLSWAQKRKETQRDRQVDTAMMSGATPHPSVTAALNSAKVNYNHIAENDDEPLPF